MKVRPAGDGLRLTRGTIGALAMLGPGAFAAEAPAQTLTVDKPCYVNVANTAAVMTVSGTGYAPGDPVLISSSDGSVDTQTTADPSGSILVQTDAPTPSLTHPGAQTVTLTAQDFTATGTTLTASTPVMATDLGVEPQPTRAKLTSRVTWYFSGFAPGKPIYGHYLRKQQVALARFGLARGACGVLKVRARFYPGGNPRRRKYRLQFDDSQRYSKHSLPRYTVQITKTTL